MHNTVLASIEFCFRGETLHPSTHIDLDLCLRQAEPMQYVYRAAAADNGISLYSYEFDLMVMEPVRFSEPTGLATGFVADGRMDLDVLLKAWREEVIHRSLQPIAQRHLGIDDLDAHPALKAALIEAYQAD